MTPSIVDQLRAVSAAPPVEAPSTRRAAPGKRIGRPPGITPRGLPARIVALCEAHPGPWTLATTKQHFDQQDGRTYSRGAVNGALRTCWSLGLIARVFVPNERIPQKSGYAYFHPKHGGPK